MGLKVLGGYKVQIALTKLSLYNDVLFVTFKTSKGRLWVYGSAVECLPSLDK